MATVLRKNGREVAPAASPLLVKQNPILIRPVRGQPSKVAYALIGRNGRALWLSMRARRLIGTPKWVTVHADVVERAIVVRPSQQRTRDTWSMTARGSIGGQALITTLADYGFPRGRYAAEYRDGELLLRQVVKTDGRDPH